MFLSICSENVLYRFSPISFEAQFGTYHVLVRLFLSIRDRAQIIDFNVFLSNDSKPSTRIVSRLLSQGMPL